MLQVGAQVVPGAIPRGKPHAYGEHQKLYKTYITEIIWTQLTAE